MLWNALSCSRYLNLYLFWHHLRHKSVTGLEFIKVVHTDQKSSDKILCALIIKCSSPVITCLSGWMSETTLFWWYFWFCNCRTLTDTKVTDIPVSLLVRPFLLLLCDHIHVQCVFEFCIRWRMLLTKKIPFYLKIFSR